ncbi:MAG: SDR family NAD(P)-dependent oxidoreductase [Chitinophagaceae bacterium]|nr:SDR family NAD(P)-dependent oxidoreductase [Chitinophagaceae bacterium]
MTQKVLIIGGSSGLGRQLATLYASDSARVAVIARRGQLLTELKNQYPSILIRQADMAEPDISSIIGAIIHELGGLDTLIIAASIIHFNPDMKWQYEKETIDVNVAGFTRVLDIAWTYFKSQGKGQIVGISSIAAIRGNKMAPAYHASKSFQHIYLESLRVRAGFEKNNITVTELIPGYMKTEMGKGDRMFWIASVEKAARQAFRAIQARKNIAFITKRWWFVFQIQKHLPFWLYEKLVNRK